jgi:NADH:ubiquinone oxidoreductase subunit 4 (subunit M)
MDMARFEIITLVPLMFFMLLVGIYPKPILSTINAASTALLSGLL